MQGYELAVKAVSESYQRVSSILGETWGSQGHYRSTTRVQGVTWRLKGASETLERVSGVPGGIQRSQEALLGAQGCFRAFQRGVRRYLGLFKGALVVLTGSRRSQGVRGRTRRSQRCLRKS